MEVANLGRGEKPASPQAAAPETRVVLHGVPEKPRETVASEVLRRVIVGDRTALIQMFRHLFPIYFPNIFLVVGGQLQVLVCVAALPVGEDVAVVLGIRPIRVETVVQLELQVGPHLVDRERERCGVRGPFIRDDRQPAFVHHILQEEAGLVHPMSQELLVSKTPGCVEQGDSPGVQITGRKAVSEQHEHACRHMLLPESEAGPQLFLIDPCRTGRRRKGVTQDLRIGPELCISIRILAQEKAWRRGYVLGDLEKAGVGGQIGPADSSFR